LNLFLFGKNYKDNILFVENFQTNETNDCKKNIKQNGGIYNFIIKDESIKYRFYTSGEKEAYIINDTNNSKRTSFVINNKESVLKDQIINIINNNFDWLHVCYLDDIECYERLLKINIPFSIDFCTNKPRKNYLEILKKASFIFDSRERKKNYTNIQLDTPIIFHDEYGAEIYQKNEIIYKTSIQPYKNLNVNGAGDLFANIFIKTNYSINNICESTKIATLETTKILLEKANNEHKKI
jgi:hypothetical protein